MLNTRPLNTLSFFPYNFSKTEKLKLFNILCLRNVNGAFLKQLVNKVKVNQNECNLNSVI